MQASHIEQSLLALFCWREAGEYGGIDCMMAVAMALKNRQREGWHYGEWLRIIQDAENGVMAYRPEQTKRNQMPDLRDPVLIKFLARIPAIYDGTTPDDYTDGGVFWANLGDVQSPYFLEKIIRGKDYAKCATVGPLNFFKQV